MKKTYTKDDLIVVWQAEKCIHCGYCARGLPEVFKPKSRPWIQTENASASEIRAQVEQCPSGALSIG